MSLSARLWLWLSTNLMYGSREKTPVVVVAVLSFVGTENIEYSIVCAVLRCVCLVQHLVFFRFAFDYRFNRSETPAKKNTKFIETCFCSFNAWSKSRRLWSWNHQTNRTSVRHTRSLWFIRNLCSYMEHSVMRVAQASESVIHLAAMATTWWLIFDCMRKTASGCGRKRPWK